MGNIPQTHSDIRQAVESATSALERLEQAIDANDNRKIGAALYELRRELRTLLTLTQQEQQS